MEPTHSALSLAFGRRFVTGFIRGVWNPLIQPYLWLSREILFQGIINVVDYEFVLRSVFVKQLFRILSQTARLIPNME